MRLDSNTSRRRGGRRTHGMSGSPEYHTWKRIIQVCTNPRNPFFKHYGGRGIRIDQRWYESFGRFFSDVGKSPFPGAELDRIDYDGNYEPGNVRWVTSKIQNNNKRSNHRVEVGGTTFTLAELSDATGLPYSTIKSRVKRGDVGDLIVRPFEPQSGETHSQSKLSDDDVRSIMHRLAIGDPQKAIANDHHISQATISNINCKKYRSVF